MEKSSAQQDVLNKLLFCKFYTANQKSSVADSLKNYNKFIPIKT